MKEFVFIVRLEELPEDQFSPAELAPLMRTWENWIDGIISQNVLVSRGNRLGSKGRTVKKGKVITNGPYAEIREIIGGYFIIRANSIDEAAEIAKGAPIIGEWNIEVRSLYDENE